MTTPRLRREEIEAAHFRHEVATATLARTQRRFLDDLDVEYEVRKRAYVAALREEYDASEALQRERESSE